MWFSKVQMRGMEKLRMNTKEAGKFLVSGALSRRYGNNKVDDQNHFLKYVMNCIFKKKSGSVR